MKKMPVKVFNEIFEVIDCVCKANGIHKLDKKHLKEAIKIFLSELKEDDYDLEIIIEDWYNHQLTDTQPRDRIFDILIKIHQPYKKMFDTYMNVTLIEEIKQFQMVMNRKLGII